MSESLRFEAVIDNNIEKINPLFSKVKIRIAYTGINRNNSFISKETFEKALPSIYNCPIIGEYIETIDDFGSHGGKVEISDKGIKYIQTTKPYGIINESSEITWEDIVEANGVVNTYLCATGYLWTGRYDELLNVIQNSKNQSMEIIVNDAKFEKINNQDVYVISDFIFSGFCILGSNVEPCFEQANIASYSLEKDEFKLQFSEMLQELKQSLNYQSSNTDVDNININQEGGTSLVEEKIKLLEKYGLTQETIDFNLEEISLEELENKLKKEFSNKPNVAEFSATYRQKRDALSGIFQDKVETDAEGKIVYEEYIWVEDFDDQYVYIERSIWTENNHERKFGRHTYTFDVATLTATVTSDFEEMIKVWLTLAENQKLQEERATATQNYENLVQEFEEYKNNYSVPNEEVNGLKEFKATVDAEKRTIAESELFSHYEESLNDVADFNALKENAGNYTLEDLEKELALMYVKHSTNFSLNKKDGSIKIKVEHSTNSESPYGGLLEKYLSKNN
jgi:hypothetical protein